MRTKLRQRKTWGPNWNFMKIREKLEDQTEISWKIEGPKD